MGLKPSCNDVDGKGLPVLGDPPFECDLAEVAREEIRSVIPEADLKFGGEVGEREQFRAGTKGWTMGRAGVSMYYEGQEADIEVVATEEVEAEAYGWKFRRLWYYWACRADKEEHALPKERAVVLNAEWGRQVRFDGFAGGKHVDGPGGHYHVDTLAGLRALVDAIREGAREPVEDVGYVVYVELEGVERLHGYWLAEDGSLVTRREGAKCFADADAAHRAEIALPHRFYLTRVLVR